MRLPPILAALPVILLSLAPQQAGAACAGRDLSGDLPLEMRAEMEAAIRGESHPEGLHWAVEKDGRESYLFGTIHLAAESVATPPPALLAQLGGAEELLLEITREEEARMARALMTDPTLVLAPGGRLLSEALSAEEWDLVTTLARDYGIPSAAVDRLAPWYLTTVLGNPACMILQEATEGDILDRRIESAAQAAGVAVTGLESFEDVFGLFGDMPYEEQVAMLRSGLPAFERAEDYMETTLQFYLRGEVLKIRAFAEAALRFDGGTDVEMRAAEALFEKLLAERNRNWMQVLLPKLEEGGRVVAVGALHIGGNDGLLTLLEAQGFTVRRLDG